MEKEMLKNTKDTGQMVSIMSFIAYYFLGTDTVYSVYIFFFALFSLIASNIYPKLFITVYRVLLKVSLIMSKVTQPIVLLCIYYLLFFPLGTIIKILKKRDFHYSFKDEKTTWHSTTKFNKENMIYQF